MKTIIGTLLLYLASIFAMEAQNYESGMAKAFDLMQHDKSLEAANLFERIGEAEGDEWLPYYYAGMILITESFEMQDAVRKEQQLEKAQEILHKTSSINIGEQERAELMVLQAMLHTSYITLNPQVYGMKLSGTVDGIYKKARELAPQNPRVLLAQTEWNIGAASFFGENPAKYCDGIQASLELFSNFKTEAEFYPKWGEIRAEQLSNQFCKTNTSK